jgi:hypothetical protein
VAVERLLPVFVSGVVETTVAVLATDPAVLGLTTMSWIVAELPAPLAGIVPREQLTVLVELVKEQVPVDGVAETYVVPAGRMSLATTFAAEAGPVFATVMV